MNTPAPVLSVDDLFKDFKGVPVINGISLSVSEGERHAVIGPNGAGKTTLFNLITGKYAASKGKITFQNTDITKMSSHAINRRGISRSFQITNIFPGLTVWENVRAAVFSAAGVRWTFWTRTERFPGLTERVFQILEMIHLIEQRSIPAGELDYGAQRALEIGITLATEPALIMLDEPTAGMSADETRETVKLVDRITRGKTLMIIEHDMEVVFRLADRITVVHYGKVLASDAPEAIRNDPAVKEAYLGEHTEAPC